MLKKITICATAAGLLAALAAAGSLRAQQPPAPPAMTQQTQNIKRTPLQKFDVPGTNYETVIGMAEIVRT